jgi:putative NADH-flavin reductase
VKILVLGAKGAVGSHLVEEAERRGHEVTRGGRETVDATDPESIALAAAGHDVVISAVIDRSAPDTVLRVARALLASRVPRAIVVGGAGTLEVGPGRRVIDLPDFNPDYRAEAQAHIDALELLRRAETPLDWTVITPPRSFDDSGRTSRYRVSSDEILYDEEGKNRISLEDFAVAALDETEHPRHARKRFSVAY